MGTATVADLINMYRSEKMPKRYSTRRACECWIRNYILPKWGNMAMTDLQARAGEMWLYGLKLFCFFVLIVFRVWEVGNKHQDRRTDQKTRALVLDIFLQLG